MSRWKLPQDDCGLGVSLFRVKEEVAEELSDTRGAF